jgi:hypothetical protein
MDSAASGRGAASIIVSPAANLHVARMARHLS